MNGELPFWKWRAALHEVGAPGEGAFPGRRAAGTAGQGSLRRLRCGAAPPPSSQTDPRSVAAVFVRRRIWPGPVRRGASRRTEGRASHSQRRRCVRASPHLARNGRARREPADRRPRVSLAASPQWSCIAITAARNGRARREPAKREVAGLTASPPWSCIALIAAGNGSGKARAGEAGCCGSPSQRRRSGHVSPPSSPGWLCAVRGCSDRRLHVPAALPVPWSCVHEYVPSP